MRRKPAVYSVHDVYPNVGINLGIFRNKWIIKLVEKLEKHCLGHANKVRVLSKSFTPDIEDLGVSEFKIELIYDWVEIGAIKPLPRNNHFSEEHNLSGKYVILYAGNIGLVQALDKAIEAV